MYQSKQNLSTKGKQQLIRYITKYISDNPLKRCKSLRRKVRLEKYIESNIHRQDAKYRFISFLPGIDILQKSTEIKEVFKNGYTCFELQGKTLNGEIVVVHLREEEEKKDKNLFLISTFYKQK